MRTTVFLAGILATVVQAGPLTSSSNFKKVRSVPVDKGEVVFYGVESTLKEAAANLERRATCGDNIVTCDDKHEAYSNTCDSLGEYLIAHEADKVGSTDHSICYELDSKNRCCVSWANGKDFEVKDLLPAYRASRRCDSAAHENLISARATYTLLANECNTQCLSNQGGTGCKN